MKPMGYTLCPPLGRIKPNGRVGSSTRRLPDDARLCDRSGDRSLARFCPAVLRTGDADRRRRGPRRATRAARSIIRRCFAISAAMPTPTCLPAAFGDEIAFRRDLSRIDMGNHVGTCAKRLSRAITRIFADAPPEELAEAVEQGLAEALQVERPHSLRPLRSRADGSPSGSACPRKSAKISASSTSAGTGTGCRAACRAKP